MLKRQLDELGRALHVNIGEVPAPPSVPQLCERLDEVLLPRLAGTTPSWFGGGYSYLYRGASAFVHPSPTGIEPLITRAPGTFQIAPARGQAPLLLQVIAEHVEMSLLIARSCSPWLVADTGAPTSDLHRSPGSDRIASTDRFV
ncbi:MAG: hypothetical protein ACLGHP_04110 [Vicinamibacteria bacterium]